MTDLQSDAGAGGTLNGTLQAEMFGISGTVKRGKEEKIKKRPVYGNGLKAPSAIGKNFVLDTNVLLHDPDCLDRFGDNHVCIPLEVLCELDKFKNEQTERGASARSVHRKLAALFSKHPQNATTGIPNREGGSVRLVPAQPEAGGRSVVVEELLAVSSFAHS
ncbi:MAG: PIN domain-containing protein [Verrucomicrobiales bacterium]